MDIYNFAPNGVINSLSETARKIIEGRIKHGKLSPFVVIGNNIRIRGVKPSVLYTTYRTILDDNTVESMYVVDHEEIQCAWINKVENKFNEINQIDRFINSMTELSWCTWETNFMDGHVTIPNAHLHGYIDVMGNTFIHCIAYACTNKSPVDIDQVEAQFQAFDFTNADLTKINNLGETPLAILCNNEELLVFVESILLRLAPEKRLQALPFSSWHKSWGSLLQSMDINLLIRQTRRLEGFLTIFFHLTHNSVYALEDLFKAGYKLQPWHFYKYKLKRQEKQLLKEQIIKASCWQNYTVWLFLIKEHTPTPFIKMRQFLCYRIRLIKEQLVIKALNPEFKKQSNII